MSTGPTYVPPDYEDLQPKFESKETPESHLLIVHIPDGFERQHIGAKVEFDFGKVRVFGERPLGNNRSSRFNVVHQVPENCDVSRIKGKFEGGTVTITMQKRVISEEVPKQELQPTEQEAPKRQVQETEPSPEKDQEGIPPPQSTTEDAQEKSTAAEVKDQKVQEGISGQDSKSTAESEEQVAHEKSKLPEATEESMPRKGEEGGNGEMQRVEKEGTKEGTETTSESGKPPKVGGLLDVPSAVEESFVEPKTTEKEKEKEKEIEAKSDEESYVPGSTVKKIKKVAASATQVVTSLAKKINEEDKQKLIYMGAAVLVVALGVYASYKIRSSRRI